MERGANELARLIDRPEDVLWPAPPAYLRDLWPLALKSTPRAPSESTVVVRPRSTDEVSAVLSWASERGHTVGPFGSGTNVVGAIDGAVDVVVSLEGMRSVLGLDEASQVVSVQAGMNGGLLERDLNTRGLTLGQYPQSLHISTVGGWVSTRATGTYSALYGGVERSLCGVAFVDAAGQVLRIPPRVRPSGGIDLLSVICGSEGSLGVITEASFVVHRRLAERVTCATFGSLRDGLRAQRELVQGGHVVGLSRLFNAAETAEVRDGQAGAAGECLLLVTTLGPEGVVDAQIEGIRATLAALGGELLHDGAADGWFAHRYATRALLEDGNAEPGRMLDTLEVSLPWSAAAACAERLEELIGPISVPYFLHFSHAYTSGVCLYMILRIRGEDDASVAEAAARVWKTVLDVVEEHGGMVGHHHGIGAARAEAYGRSADGSVHRRLKRALDPQGLLHAPLLGDGLRRAGVSAGAQRA
jgi:alkyldihydroxyacetonephosphate synthase